MSTGRSNLDPNDKGNNDSLWFRNPTNIFAFRGYATTINNIPERFDIPCLANVAGTTPYSAGAYKFEIDKRVDLLGPVKLLCARGVGSGDATARFADFEGYNSIDWVKFWYKGRVFYQCYGDQLLKETLQRKKSQEREGIARVQYGFLTDAQRVTQFQTATCWVADLQVPWEHLKKHIPMLAMPDKIEVEVQFKTLATCCYASGSPNAPTLVSLSLRIEGHHILKKYQSAFWNMVHLGKGVSLKHHSVQYHRREPVTNVTSLQTINLRNFTNSAFCVELGIRTTANVDTQTTLDPNNYIRPARWYLQDNGQRITNIVEMNDTAGTTPSNFNIYDDNVRIHPNGIVGLYFGCLPFCDHDKVELSDDNCYGSRFLKGYNNLQLALQFDSAPGGTCYADIYEYCHNMLVYRKGDIHSFLAVP
jgi:hypothetical protein